MYGSGLEFLPPITEATSASSLYIEDKRHYQGAMTRVLENSELVRYLFLKILLSKKQKYIGLRIVKISSLTLSKVSPIYTYRF